MKIRPVGTELFRADGQTDSHGEANRHFSQLYELSWKKCGLWNSDVQYRQVPSEALLGFGAVFLGWEVLDVTKYRDVFIF